MVCTCLQSQYFKWKIVCIFFPSLSSTTIGPILFLMALLFYFARCECIPYPSDLNDIIRRTESVSTSSNLSKGDGLDAQLEEVSKDSKTWAVGALTATERLRIFRNHDNLAEVSFKGVFFNGLVSNSLGHTDYFIDTTTWPC